MSEKLRFTRTTRHLTNPSFSDGDVFATPASTAPTFIPRLSWSSMPQKAEYDAGKLCEGLANAPDVAFFCDNSIFDDRMPPDLYMSLVDSRAELRLTPRIEQELKPWLDRRPSHPISDALSGGRLTLETAADWSDAEQQAFIHYTNILGFRKRLMGWGELEFEKRYRRKPAHSDSTVVRSIVQQTVRERGFMFAKKGAIERAKRGRLSFADEELVYTAVAYALRTGRQTIILTKDEDLIDQFYRLLYLIDTHYRSMLIAQRYLADLASFRTYPIPNRDDWVEAFVPSSGVLVERHPDLPEEVLPQSFNFVAVSCWLIGDRYQSLTFGAETGMHGLLEVKGRTGGRNTDCLGPRNCHLSIANFSSPGPGIPMCFAVAQDRAVSIAGQSVPWVELNDAAMGMERFKTMRYSPVIIP